MRVSFFAFYCSLLAATLGAQTSATAEEAVKVASRGDKNAEYAIKMLKLALSKSGANYEVDVRNDTLTSQRLHQELLDGTLDIHWTATNRKLEESVLPVRVPLYKGLLGYRVLLINKDNIGMFSGVESLQDLKRHTFGQGRGWTDATILESNGLSVVQTAKYESLFHMVDGGRFDAFPRGVHEPWGEIEQRPDLDLTVDTNILLVYRMPYYLFVSPHRPELARDIELGFRKAIDDGSFDQVFFADSTVQMALTKANIKGRKIFNLQNPDLPKETPLDDRALWLNIDRL